MDLLLVPHRYWPQDEHCQNLNIWTNTLGEKVKNIDRVMRQPSKQLAGLHARGGDAGTYLYEFTLEFPFMHDKIAWHCSDIPFFFHNTDRVEICGIPGVSDELEEQIFGAFMAFVRSGRPDYDKLPEWPAVTSDREPTMTLDRRCEVRMNFDDDLYALIDRVLPPFDLMSVMASQDIQH